MCATVTHVLPVTCLQILRDELLKFTPPLRPARMDALKRLDFANGLKMFLKFNKRIWPLDCRGAICSHSFAPEVWFASSSSGAPGDEGVHVATFFAMSERADRIAALPLATAVSMALSQVCRCDCPASTRASFRFRVTVLRWCALSGCGCSPSRVSALLAAL